MVAKPTAAPGLAPAEEEHAGKWTVLAIVALGVFMATLDSSVVNISLPTIARHFGRPLDTAVMWVVIAYLVVVASLMLTIGRFRRRGRAQADLAPRARRLHHRLGRVRRRPVARVVDRVPLGPAFVALLGFVLVEPRVRHPILDFGLFRSRVFASGTISLALSFTSIFAVGFVMPFYLEELRHFPTGTSGLLLTPYTIVIALVALPSGALADRFGTRWLAAGGMTIACVGLVLLGSLDASAPKADVIWRLGLTGLGQGMFQALNNSAILGAVPANRQGAASGILATGRVVGQCLSVAIAGAVFSSLGGASAGRALAVDRHDEGPFREGLQNSPISDLHHIGEFSPAPSQGATAKCAVLAVASATAAAGAMCWRKTRVVWRASLDKAPLGMAGTRL